MARKYNKRVDSKGKIDALRRHMVKKVPVSEICEELGVQPSTFYLWQNELFLRGADLFDNKPGPKKKTDNTEKRIEQMEQKLSKKDEVIAELLEEHVALKKSLGVH